MGWQPFSFATASTLIILLEGLSAILSPLPPPHQKKKNTGFKVYQRISCKSFLYLGDNVYMRNSNDYHSHLKMAAKQKWYSKENGSLIALK